MSQMQGPWHQPPTMSHAGAHQVYGQPPRAQQVPAATSSPWARQQPNPSRSRFGAAGQQPPKKKSMLRTIIFWAFVFFVVIPFVTSLISSFNDQMTSYQQPAPPPPPPPTSSTPAPGGEWVPGPPDLNPNDPPFPTTYDDVRNALANNPLYSQYITPTNCGVADIDLVNSSPAVIEQYMNEFMECLMKTWHDPVTAANFSLPRPSVTVYTSEINTRCGQVPMYNAVYCSADQQVYYAKNLIDAFPPQLRQSRYIAESVIAHEFGHAIQYRTMILMSQAVLAHDADTQAEEWDTSRRLEMQADCFAGLYLNSIADSTGLTSKDRSNIEAIFASLGGRTPYKDDHGMGSNRAWWTNQGLNAWTPGVCNTFVASEESVG